MCIIRRVQIPRAPIGIYIILMAAPIVMLLVLPVSDDCSTGDGRYFATIKRSGLDQALRPPPPREAMLGINLHGNPTGGGGFATPKLRNTTDAIRRQH